MTNTDPLNEELGAKVDRLEKSTRRLGDEIDRLGTSLLRVRKLEDAQVELREQTTLAMFNALAAHDQADANHKRLTTMNSEHAVIDARRRFAARAVLLGMMILLPIVAALLYASLLSKVDNLVGRQRQDLIRGCGVRNQIIKLTIDSETKLAATSISDAQRKIHQQTAANYRPLLVDCATAYNNFTVR